MALSDSLFIKQFENKTLKPELFNHLGHLRLAWLYLNKHPLTEAIEKMTSGLRAYASHLGASDKFQYTLTEATLRIIALRMEEGNATTFASYLENNRDLVEDMHSVLAIHYSQDALNSEHARTQFVHPDLAPFASPNAI